MFAHTCNANLWMSDVFWDHMKEPSEDWAVEFGATPDAIVQSILEWVVITATPAGNA